MPFESLLSMPGANPPTAADPSVMTDLNLDQVFSHLAKGREAYDLLPLYSAPLTEPAAIVYRQEVFRDLEQASLRAPVDAFAETLRSVRAGLGQSDRLRNRLQRARWYLDSVREYCRGVDRLAEALERSEAASHGMRALGEHLAAYRRSGPFQSLVADVERLRAELGNVTYCVRCQGGRVTVSRYSGERDYGAEIAATFRRFPEAAPAGRPYTFHEWAEMNPVEEAIQDRVAKLFPAVFEHLQAFPARHPVFLDPVVARADREAQFFLAYLDVVARLRTTGLGFCYPEVSVRTSEMDVRDTFDLALALRLDSPRSPVVPNDIELRGSERVVVVSGPNNGGKTTFARTFGQLHFLARLGCPVPGTEGSVFLSDRIFTHFARAEKISDLRGKLMDELVRVHAILEGATDRSVIILNETFASATVQDALFLGRQVLERVDAKGAVCVYVTFLDELSRRGKETVSVVSTVSPDDPEVRTFRLVRRTADGRAYAVALARKYGLTYDRLQERIPG